MVKGISTAGLGLPEYERACEQHRSYIAALESCGLRVKVLEADEAHPDSVFVEDVALLTPHCAIITRPGALSRRGETKGLSELLSEYYKDIYSISEPGTLEAGDVMMVGDTYYIGLSERTNRKGADQLIGLLEQHGMKGIMVGLEEVLHLKTGVSYLENNKLLACGEFIEKAEFSLFNISDSHLD